MINHQPIAFMDSGIGGLPYLLMAREILPSEEMIYFADYKYFPYGLRKADEIVQIVLKHAQKIVKKEQPKMFVLACNSASVSALEPLRETLNLPVVGVVPAIKPAAEQSQAQKIDVLATQRTVEASYLQDLIDHFAQGQEVIQYAATELVDFVEEQWLNAPEKAVDDLVKPIMEQLLDEGVDQLVLGCTHFTYFAESISRLSQNKIQPVDSREGVVRQINRILQRNRILASPKNQPRDARFYCSQERENGLYSQLADKYHMDYRGLL